MTLRSPTCGWSVPWIGGSCVVVLLLCLLANGPHGNAGGVAAVSLHEVQPTKNMWVTWANQTGQTSFCLSLASATDPFQTCLFRAPIGDPEHLATVMKGFFTGNCTNQDKVSETALCIINSLNVTLGPCYLDQLTLFALDIHTLRYHTRNR